MPHAGVPPQGRAEPQTAVAAPARQSLVLGASSSEELEQVLTALRAALPPGVTLEEED